MKEEHVRLRWIYNSREKSLTYLRIWSLLALEIQVISFLLDTIHHHVNFSLDLPLEKLLCFPSNKFCCSPPRICQSACYDHHLRILLDLVVVSSRMLVVNVLNSNRDGHHYC